MPPRVTVDNLADILDSLQETANHLESISTDLAIGPGYSKQSIERRIFAGNTFAGTAKAPVVAPPTTSPEWMLWNGEGAGGKKYVILEAACTLISGTTGLGLALLGGVGKIPETANPTAYASSVIASTGGSNAVTNARIVNNATLLSTPAYHVLAQQDQTAVDGLGLGLVAKLEGKYAIPPGYGFALEVFGETGTTALFAVSFVWIEM